MTKLKVGIAGYGIVGKRRKDCIDRSKYADVIAVCDRTFESSGITDEGLKFFTTYSDLIQEDLDVLLVCMPNQIAAEVTIAGLNKGLHTFCEKPPGRTVEDITSVIKVERDNPSLKLMYGFNHRHHDSIKKMKKLIDEREFGKVLWMRGRYGKSVDEKYYENWRAKRKYAGGGILIDQGIHMLDLFLYFGNDFDNIHATVSNLYWKLE